MKESKKYWKGIEELANDVEFVKNADKEFPEYLPINENSNGGDGSVEGMLTHRRDFLKLLGFGMAAVSLAACEAPVKKAIPYLNKPQEIDPGIANFYATTYVDGGDYCSVLVKTREGRPIKVEGNNLSSVTRGGTFPRVQASVLSLYDVERFKGPQINGKDVLWEEVDRQIAARLAQTSGKAIRIVSPTIISPATKQVIAEFRNRYPSTELVQYDAVSSSGMLNANQQSFGIYALPSYDFSTAETIVSFSADFLGTWVSPVEFARHFGQNRKLGKTKKTMSRLYVFESTMSLTGANADYRLPVRPSEEGLYVAALYNAIAKQTGGTTVQVTAPKNMQQVEQAAKDLLANRGKSLVVSGSNDVNVQLMVNAINMQLGNYGATIDLSTPMYTRQGDDANMVTLVNDVKAGNVGAILFMGANPVYDFALGNDLKAALNKVPLRISFADRPDETSVLCEFVCPDLHYLEAWGDAEPKKGYYSLIQPTISPIFKGRLVQESLLAWAGKPQDYYSFLQNYWRANIFPQQKQFATFQEFWNRSLHDGVFEVQGTRVSTDTIIPGTSTMEGLNVGQVASMNRGYVPQFNANLSNTATYIAQRYKANASGVDLVVYQTVGLGTGSQANNPWLQEFPDPISKACWDNYIAMPKSLATSLDVKQDDVVRLEIKGKPAIELPVLIQPGQAANSVAVAVGYGREVTGKTAKGVGANAYPLISSTNTGLMYSANDVQITKTSNTRRIAQTQTHETIMARPVVQEAKLSEYQKNPAAGRELVHIQTAEGPVNPTDISLWNVHKYANHAWGMVIDLNSCIGCGACVIGCQAENNVPVVGRDEVLNRREMHWLRIDRYYSSAATKEDGYRALEEASENPEVVFQPMLCQHCNNAPCETVCPVAATTHSTEGINQMAYNRCVGTRYCANNCPYKVRRFNWFSYPENDKFDFHMNNDLGKMVLNPDVTVRARGVMEKCTFCVQRIQAGKLEAKKERRRPIDGTILTACAQACPTQAISFGDMNDPDSVVSQILNEEYDKRAFHVLEEINTRPNVSYLTKIRNKA
jgi:MoCo/4Fe-4S cofactor protein with predicted Tat translocation signal